MKRIVWLLFAAPFTFFCTADSYYVSDVWPKNQFANTSPVPITSTYSPSNHNSNLGYGLALIDRLRSYKQQQTILYDYQSQINNDRNESYAYEQKYTLSDQTKTYIKKQGFSKKIWTKSLYGTKQQQQLHASFILLTEKAVLKIHTQSLSHDLYQSVIDHAAAGCLATRANNTDLAYSLQTFCMALFDCAELVTSAILNGTKSAIAPILHPIQTTQEIISDIELITQCTVNLVNRAVDLASVRTKNDFELWKQKQTHDIEKLYTILCDECAQTPRGIIQTHSNLLFNRFYQSICLARYHVLQKFLKTAKAISATLYLAPKNQKILLLHQPLKAFQ